MSERDDSTSREYPEGVTIGPGEYLHLDGPTVIGSGHTSEAPDAERDGSGFRNEGIANFGAGVVTMRGPTITGPGATMNISYEPDGRMTVSASSQAEADQELEAGQ